MEVASLTNKPNQQQRKKSESTKKAPLIIPNHKRKRDNDKDETQQRKKRKLNKNNDIEKKENYIKIKIRNLYNRNRSLLEESMRFQRERDRFKKERDLFKKEKNDYKQQMNHYKDKFCKLQNKVKNCLNITSSQNTNNNVYDSNINDESSISSSGSMNTNNGDIINNGNNVNTHILSDTQKYNMQTHINGKHYNGMEIVKMQENEESNEYEDDNEGDDEYEDEDDMHSESMSIKSISSNYNWEECHFVSVDCKYCKDNNGKIMHFDDFNEYVNHLKCSHFAIGNDENRVWSKCSECRTSFTGKSPFISHLATHGHQKPFHCNLSIKGKMCDFTASTKGNLKKHLEGPYTHNITFNALKSPRKYQQRANKKKTQ